MKVVAIFAFLVVAMTAVSVEAHEHSYSPRVVEIEEPAKVLETKSVHVVKEEPVVKVATTYGGYAPLWGGSWGAPWGGSWGSSWGGPRGWAGSWGGPWGGHGGYGGY